MNEQANEGQSLDLTRYEPAAYNILSPILRLDTAAPYLRLRAVEVRLDPDINKGDCYAAPGTKWLRDRAAEPLPVLVAPSKPGLMKIASAAGLIIDPRGSRRIRPDACDRCLDLARMTGQAQRCGDCNCRYDVAYQYIGAVRTEGGWRILKATYEWNLDAQERKIRREARKREEGAQRKGDIFNVEAYIEDRIDQVISERYGLAETKALLRLVRAICNLRQSYAREEMARPFVVVRTELAPDYSDPAVRHALAQRAAASGAEIFGAADKAPQPVAALPIGAVQVVDQLTRDPDFDRDRERANEVPPETELDAPDEADLPEGAAAPGPIRQLGTLPMEAPRDAAQAESGRKCDLCDNTVPAPVVRYCQSPAGAARFGGTVICFQCQRKGSG